MHGQGIYLMPLSTVATPAIFFHERGKSQSLWALALGVEPTVRVVAQGAVFRDLRLLGGFLRRVRIGPLSVHTSKEESGRKGRKQSRGAFFFFFFFFFFF